MIQEFNTQWLLVKQIGLREMFTVVKNQHCTQMPNKG